MLNKIQINRDRQKLIAYLVLTIVTFAVYWQVNQFDFVNFDDHHYIKHNIHVQSGMTIDSIHWAFSTKYFGLWNPLVWLSFMFDYQIFGLNAAGYHINNLILHILSALLLFWLFNRMTNRIWESAFVATLFALHPLHVESVAWISERKDVLSAFFWILTLCLYAYYTEKPCIKRYLLVLLAFIPALLSKPMVVTLPVIMILLDYWPLKRFETHKSNVWLWQLKEKTPFFILSIILIIITLYSPSSVDIPDNPDIKQFSHLSRMTNAPVAFVTYLEKTFWPHNMTIFYPVSEQISLWQFWGASLLILMISIAIIIKIKHRPYLFVGWFWFTISIAPVIGIIQISLSAPYIIADRYHYLPSIGIAIMLAWGVPSLFKNQNIRQKVLFTLGIIFLALMGFLSWRQCGYWRNSIELWNHALQVTTNNRLAYNNRGAVYDELGQYELAIKDYNEVIKLQPGNFQAYNSRGNMYSKLNNYQSAIVDYDEAIRLKPDFADAYYNRGTVYNNNGNYQLALENFNKAIGLKNNDSSTYNNRGTVYFKLGQYQPAIMDFNEAIRLKPDYADAFNNRGGTFFKLGRYQMAISDFDKAIRLKPGYADAHHNKNLALNEIAKYGRILKNKDTVVDF